MSGDEFSEIERLFRPLTGGAAGAFDLLDDAAVVAQRAGFDLVVTKDAIVEGVHVPVGERGPLGRPVARRPGHGEKAGEGLGRLGRQVGEVDPQQLAGHIVRRLAHREMHALDNGVLGHHQVVAGPRRDRGGVVHQIESAGRAAGQRAEQPRDLGELISSGHLGRPRPGPR